MEVKSSLGPNCIMENTFANRDGKVPFTPSSRFHTRYMTERPQTGHDRCHHKSRDARNCHSEYYNISVGSLQVCLCDWRKCLPSLDDGVLPLEDILPSAGGPQRAVSPS